MTFMDRDFHGSFATLKGVYYPMSNLVSEFPPTTYHDRMSNYTGLINLYVFGGLHNMIHFKSLSCKKN